MCNQSGRLCHIIPQPDPDVLLLSHPLDNFSREEGRKYLNFVKRWVTEGGLWLGEHSKVKAGAAGKNKGPIIFQKRPRTVLIADDLLRDELASEFVDDIVVIPSINKRRERSFA